MVVKVEKSWKISLECWQKVGNVEKQRLKVAEKLAKLKGCLPARPKVSENFGKLKSSFRKSEGFQKQLLTITFVRTRKLSKVEKLVSQCLKVDVLVQKAISTEQTMLKTRKVIFWENRKSLDS